MTTILLALLTTSFVFNIILYNKVAELELLYYTRVDDYEDVDSDMEREYKEFFYDYKRSEEDV